METINAFHLTLFILLDYADCSEHFPKWVLQPPNEIEPSFANLFETSAIKPRFLHDNMVANVSVKKGSDAFLHCKVSGIGDQSVSWYKRKKDKIQLLTFGFQTYYHDGRFSLHFVQPYDWRLRIRSVSHRDVGTYECQVSTHPPLIRVVNLGVVVPVIKLLDDRGMQLREKFYKTGSTIILKCEATNVPSRHPVIHLHWHHGRRRLSYDDPRGGISVKTEICGLSANSWLRINNAQPSDSGSYFCIVSGLRPRKGYIHIVPDEFPAAIQKASREGFPLYLTCFSLILAMMSHLELGELSYR